MFGLEPTQATVITITPVSNGWVVKLPKATPGADIMKGMMKFGKGMKQILDDDQIIPGLNAPVEQEEEEEAQSLLTRDNNTYIFTKFEEVLGFLKYMITDEEQKK